MRSAAGGGRHEVGSRGFGSGEEEGVALGVPVGLELGGAVVEVGAEVDIRPFFQARSLRGWDVWETWSALLREGDRKEKVCLSVGLSTRKVSFFHTYMIAFRESGVHIVNVVSIA